MAIVWELIPSVIREDDFSVSVVAMRSDDADPSVPVTTYRVDKGYLETPEQQLAIVDEIWAKHQAALARISRVNTFLGTLTVTGKSNLEARE